MAPYPPRPRPLAKALQAASWIRGRPALRCSVVCWLSSELDDWFVYRIFGVPLPRVGWCEEGSLVRASPASGPGELCLGDDGQGNFAFGLPVLRSGHAHSPAS